MKSDGTFMRVLLYGLVLASHWVLGPVVVPAQGEATVSKISPSVERRIQEGYGKLPLSFEANEGQTDRSVQFLSRGQGYQLFLTSTEAVLMLSPSAAQQVPQTSQTETADQITFRLQLVGANPHPQGRGENVLPGKVNYFLGKDPMQWRSNVPTYEKVRYRDVYPGIDVVYYGNQRQLEFDFVVSPGADTAAIRLAVDGADQLRVEADDVVIQSGGEEIRLHQPAIWQEINGVKQAVAGSYVLLPLSPSESPSERRQQVGFQVAAYDASKPLIIDPVLSYSTYLGGSGIDRVGGTMVVDAAGSAYVSGNTSSINFPTTTGSVRPTPVGGVDAYVAKLNPTGTGLVYSTYLGGTNTDVARGMALDAAGNVYLIGQTNSTNFPTTPGAFQPAYAGGPFDVFAAKLDASGSTLLYSTYLGGTDNDEAGAIAVDQAGNAYLTGDAQANFPTTGGVLSTAFISGDAEIFVAKLNATGTGLLYSTAIPGAHPGTDAGLAIAVDAVGYAYVAGATRTGIGTTGAFQTTYQGGGDDAFVLKLNPAASALVYATNLGGASFDEAYSLAVDPAGNAFVCGGTWSSNFPTTSGALQTILGGLSDNFVTKLDPTGSTLVYSTFLGGSGEDGCASLALDPATGNVVLAGGAGSTNMQTTTDAFQTTKAGGFDAYIAKLDATGGQLLFGSYLGGAVNDGAGAIALDNFWGNAYVTGGTSSTNFPTTTGAFRTTFGGAEDAFVTKILFVLPVTIDIKPGSFPNSINLGSQGTVPVAIFGSATFDVTQVDPLTVTLADAPVKLKGKGTPMVSFQDLNGDGFMDMVVHVSTQALQLTVTDTEAVVEGSTVGGMPFKGKDSIRIVSGS